MSHVVSSVRTILRLEGLSMFGLAIYVYQAESFSWALFAACFFIPDIALLGYLASAKLGAITYNLAHSLVGPLVALGFGLSMDLEAMRIASLIWLAHVGFDRALGFGLKYGSGFSYTHLGNLGNTKVA